MRNIKFYLEGEVMNMTADCDEAPKQSKSSKLKSSVLKSYHMKVQMHGYDY